MRKQALDPRTAAINHRQKNCSKQQRLEALQWLKTKFPAAFDNQKQIRPLNVGIMQDILKYADEAAAVGISKSKLREAVVLYTRRLDYLACLKSQEVRIDLFGHPSVPVQAEDAERASLKMKKRVEKYIKNVKKAPSNVTELSCKIRPFAQPEVGGNSLVYENLERENLVQSQPKPPHVLITRKQSRTFDPAAVARLKQKLGIGVHES